MPSLTLGLKGYASKDITASLHSVWNVIAESEFCCAAYPLSWIVLV